MRRKTPGLVRVLVHSDARQTIATAAERAHPLEAGGLLLGWWDRDAIVVRAAVDVVDPTATGSSWIRREGLAQQALDQAVTELGHPWLGYVGDWHSHPAPCGASEQDRQSIRSASLAYPQPLLLLVHRRGGNVDMHAARRGRLQAVSIETM
ncbi:Mov34/MPN/PAD-1 family protein [Paractinoplanes atraurantiacus]|uniref:Mov34/MPN/PAD-1 family protein n=1 Tax=Paractinoplanes atraurantiacus TaxID=1036182 RepID=UPI0015CF3D63|nr:Mov34/MPN/PAD-1 family protein [Actinoplanes atraurantiacus]